MTGAGDQEEDIWWYACTLCYRAFVEDARLLKSHQRLVHGSKGTGNILILSQTVDLEPKVKVTRWSGAKRTTRFATSPPAAQSPPICDNFADTLDFQPLDAIVKQEWSETDQFLQPASVEPPECRPGLPRPPNGNGKTCDVCGAVYKSWQLLKKHFQDVHKSEDGRFPCHICGRKYRQLQDLNSHKRTHEIDPSSTTPVLCPECGKMFKAELSLKRHIRAVHSEKRYKCQKCDAAFRMKHVLDRHDAEVHVAKKVFTCPQCPKTFKSRHRLKDHTRETHQEGGQHSRSSRKQCRVCGQEFPGYASARNHELRVHDYQPPNGGGAQCKTCGQKFSSPWSLRAHERRHGNERSIKCDACGKGFKSSNNLWQHRIQFHNTTRSNICEICGKGYKTRTNLNQHRMTHVPYEELPHVCKVCGKRFGWSGVLQMHLAVHTDERPHPCPRPECPMMCKTEQLLKRHLWTSHSGWRPKKRLRRKV